MQRKILIVSNLFPPFVVGGAEIVAARQARALAALGNEVVVFAGCFAGEGREPGSLDCDMMEGISVYRVALISLAHDDNFFRPEFARRLQSVMERHQPDVVHFHNPMGLGANLIPLARNFGARVVVTLHDHWGFCVKNTLLLADDSVCKAHENCSLCLPTITVGGELSVPIRLRRDYVAWCLGHAGRLLSPSVYMANAYNDSNIISRTVESLSNGIDLSVIQPKADKFTGPVQFSCFSYLGRHKGIAILLDAAEKLAGVAELQGRWSLKIAGHGDLEPMLESKIASGVFNGAVEYLGRIDRPSVLSTLAKTHVMVLASIWPENEPVTLLEAIASGTAQLVSRIGGNIDLVDEGESGLLFSPGDSDDLFRAMVRFVKETDLARTCGEYNSARRHRFAETRTIERLNAIYAEPPPEARCEEFVVLCAGQAAAPELQLMMHRFHIMEPSNRRVRFIWSAWADTSIWFKAQLFWIWGDLSEVDEALLSQALRFEIPVLAAKSSRYEPIAGLSQNPGAYESLLEALGLIAALADSPDASPALPGSCQSQALLFDSVVGRASFSYPLKSIP